jgi:hypothetical protein
MSHVAGAEQGERAGEERKQAIPDQKIAIAIIIIINTTHGCGNTGFGNARVTLRVVSFFEFGSSVVEKQDRTKGYLMAKIAAPFSVSTRLILGVSSHSGRLLGHSQARFGKGAGTRCSGQSRPRAGGG